MPQIERRKYRRIDMKVRVELSPYDASEDRTVQQNAESRNVSARGLLVTVANPIDVSPYVLARFALPGTSLNREFVARVARIDEAETPGKYDVGLEFVESLLPEDAIVEI